jgi:hypothetical protein
MKKVNRAVPDIKRRNFVAKNKLKKDFFFPNRKKEMKKNPPILNE